MKKPSILVVGSINMDLMVYGVPRLPGYGESLFCENYGFAAGGKGANQAVAAARLGADAYLVGRMGKDGYADELMDSLTGYGVHTDGIVCDPESQTGLAQIMVDRQTAKYVSYVVLGGNAAVKASQVEDILSAHSFDMVLMQLEIELETVYRTYELAAAKGIPVFLDAGPAMDIPLERLNGIFVISPNEAEAQALTGMDVSSDEGAKRAADTLFRRVAPRYVILKLGARGALLYDGKQFEQVPCFTQLKAVDSTAAGDTFGAAFAVKYCAGGSAQDSIVFAHAAAGLCVSRKGAQVSIPDLHEVEAFLKNTHTEA